MNGYCPAGKMECERWNGRGCVVDAATERGFSDVALSDIEVCPWPSRQVRVEPQGDCDKCPKDDAYAAGRLAGLREAMDAVANIRLRFDSDTPGNVDLTLPEFQWVRDKAIAAIDAVKGE